MRAELNCIMVKEMEALRELLKLLDEQHNMLVKNDVYGLEDIVSRIQLSNKAVAEAEVERRRLAAGQTMSRLVETSSDAELDNNFRKIKMLLSELQLQKDTNELLIRQGLGFSTKMLSILNPDRNSKTYNSYGKLGKW